MLAPDGRCKTLDAAADGYVRSEAAGMLVLQLVSDAPTTGCLGLIVGSAVNQDGRSSTLTAPNGPAQQKVLKAALQDALLKPGDVSGLELHGTGTPLGRAVRSDAHISCVKKDFACVLDSCSANSVTDHAKTCR